jgi:hypothetical protein
MPKRSDDEPVIFTYSSMRNIKFRGAEDSGYTWGDWREMSSGERDDAVQEYANQLVDVSVKDENE